MECHELHSRSSLCMLVGMHPCGCNMDLAETAMAECFVLQPVASDSVCSCGRGVRAMLPSRRCLQFCCCLSWHHEVVRPLATEKDRGLPREQVEVLLCLQQPPMTMRILVWTLRGVARVCPPPCMCSALIDTVVSAFIHFTS